MRKFSKFKINPISYLAPDGLLLDFEDAVIGNSFWGEGIEFVGAIVGSNGVGKTTILEDIAAQEDKEFQKIFYSPFLSKPLYDDIRKSLSSLVDISKFRIMDEDVQSTKISSFQGCYNQHESKNAERLINFMQENKKKEIIKMETGLPIFDKIRISFNFMADTPSLIRIPRAFRPFFEEYRNIESRSEKSSVKDKFLNNCYITIIKKIQFIFEISESTYLEECELEDADTYFSEAKDLEKALYYFFEKAKRSSTSSFILPLRELKELIDLIKKQDPISSASYNSFYANFDDAKAILLAYRKFKEKLAKPFDDKDHYYISFLNFEPSRRLSSGEQSMYRLFSLCFDKKSDIIDTAKPLFLLMDEPDLDFHPLWKKKFIKILLATLPKILSGKKLSILFSTHDPITLSDIPRNNIIALKKDGDRTIVSKEIGKTFAANVTDLLSNSFFLEGGLIGEFAIDRINEIISWINKNESPKDRGSDFKEKKAHYEKVIKIIDESILQLKLAEMLDELTNESLQSFLIDKEIETLKKMKK